MTRDEAFRNYLTWALIASALTGLVRGLLEQGAHLPGFEQDFEKLTARLLADGKNTVAPDGLSIEDEAYAVGKAIDQLEQLFAKLRGDLRDFNETGLWPDDDRHG